jgi:hypothetical protein
MQSIALPELRMGRRRAATYTQENKNTEKHTEKSMPQVRFEGMTSGKKTALALYFVSAVTDITL